ncbi:MAG: tetratricopeptide repeat protein, partial [Candidatus Competibacteraceae bacterium]|nr:tetratricopeptide repeat protein [Candidatus Competibacteraceae bacterium]
NAGLSLRRGQAQYRMGDYPAALRSFVQTDSAFWRGNALFRLGRYAEALRAFQTALAKPGEEQALAHFNAAQTQLVLKQYALALDLYRQILLQTPDHPQAKLGLAQSLLELREYTEAITVLQDLTMDNRVAREARYLLGLAYLQTGALNEAVPLLERAAQEGPYFKEALRSLVRANRRLGFQQRADIYEQQLARFQWQAKRLHTYFLEDTH